MLQRWVLLKRKRDIFLKKTDDWYKFDHFAYLNELVQIVFSLPMERLLSWRYCKEYMEILAHEDT